MNKCILTGRLTADPELKTTKNEKTVCTFTIAVDRKIKTADGQTADFFDCAAWNKTGEFVNKYFTKGKMICLDGSIQTRKWKSDKGETHTGIQIKVDSVEFCGDKSSDGKVENNTGNKPKTSQADIEQDDADDDDELPF